MKHIMLDLPPELLDALEHVAGRDEVAIASLVRDAVRNDLKQRASALASRTQRMPIGMPPPHQPTAHAI
ncbi:ribbon-helix-helix domain-containing protein [Loktanella sp. S4079]|uniref:ribbon-helix-helix domain-containing protein n=1 Tax=Loktanella sp. S4079 TaxID=579483 RepID=UPI0005FA2A65|nr:CopG family transcriptional regulator [Loktanella sp. S4079]KJZ18935.1 hypothetical protein TW80_12740 [Loktanella sp. S4079]